MISSNDCLNVSKSLPTSVIHNDANDNNVLVEPHGKWRNRVSGVIDFGDMVFTCTVGEVAIACAYAMLNKADPLTAAAHIVAGYHENRTLTEPELEVLFDLICMRLCMSVCHAANQSRFEPDNEYLRISEKPVWALLKKLQNIHQRLARYVLRHACGLTAVPHSGKIIDWLKGHRAGFASIVDENLRHENQLVFDLSVGSALPHTEGDDADLAVFSEHLMERIRLSLPGTCCGRCNRPVSMSASAVIMKPGYYTRPDSLRFRPMKCRRPVLFIWALICL